MLDRLSSKMSMNGSACCVVSVTSWQKITHGMLSIFAFWRNSTLTVVCLGGHAWSTAVYDLTNELFTAIKSHLPDEQCYTDDQYLYISLTPNDASGGTRQKLFMKINISHISIGNSEIVSLSLVNNVQFQFLDKFRR